MTYRLLAFALFLAILLGACKPAPPTAAPVPTGEPSGSATTEPVKGAL